MTRCLGNLTKPNWGQWHEISLKCTSKPYLNPSANKNRNGGDTGTGKTARGRREEWKQEISAAVWMQQHCNSDVRRWSLWLTHWGWWEWWWWWVFWGEGGGGGYRLPALAHPALPISCLLTEKMPSSTSLQLKSLLSQPRRRLRRSDRPNISFLRPSHISFQTLPGDF